MDTETFNVPGSENAEEVTQEESPAAAPTPTDEVPVADEAEAKVE